ncbi:MAG: C40 family peptidase [Ruminococcus sp.]|nr:C40 family peptidase [Ruminococcus sp.]
MNTMNKLLSKTVLFIIGLLMIGAFALPNNTVTVNAVNTLARPLISESAVFSGKYELRLDNSEDYDENTSFLILVDGKQTSSVSYSSLKSKNFIFEITGGDEYFTPLSTHMIKVKAAEGDNTSAYSKGYIGTTEAKTVYYSAKGRTYYKLKNGKLTEAGTLPDAVYVTAVLSDESGNNCEGLNRKTNTAKYILITEGDYKGCYLSVSLVKRKTEEQVKAALPAAPQLTEEFISSDKLGIGISNLSKYRDDTVFKVYVGGKLLKTVKLSAVQRDGYISIYNDTAKYLKKSTDYKITFEAVSRQLSAKTTKSFTTADVTYYKVKPGTAYYELTDGKFTKVDTTAYVNYGTGERTDAKGKALAGKAVSNSEAYVKLVTGTLKGYYVSVSGISRTREANVKKNDRQSKIDTVVAYAKANVGGYYISCGERYRATDCSGLTMLAYRQIGVSLPHSAYGQMCLGKRVSSSEMQPGDIIIANGYNHAMMYVGDGMVVHAMNPRDGIRMQPASTAMYYNPVNAIVRLI